MAPRRKKTPPAPPAHPSDTPPAPPATPDDRRSPAGKEFVSTKLRCPKCDSSLQVIDTPSGGRTISVLRLGETVENNPRALERFEFGASRDVICPACNARFEASGPYRPIPPLKRRHEP